MYLWCYLFLLTIMFSSNNKLPKNDHFYSIYMPVLLDILLKQITLTSLFIGAFLFHWTLHRLLTFAKLLLNYTALPLFKLLLFLFSLNRIISQMLKNALSPACGNEKSIYIQCKVCCPFSLITTICIIAFNLITIYSYLELFSVWIYTSLR